MTTSFIFLYTTSPPSLLFGLLSQINPLCLSLPSRVCSLKLTDFMLMESLMMEEKKQLDFNRPLISIRRPIQPDSKRRSSDSVTNKIPPSPPVYKSDINSGPVRNPGTVPFQWEHKPGKPKDETKPELQSVVVEQHFVPKLPPGRIVKAREPEELVRKPETRTNHVEDAKSCSSWYDDDESDDTYLDATDTLSRSESFFFNCSNVSGQGMLVEPFGTLSSDRQTQDLMMGRFLPAAKALTSETPPHLARKPPKPEEPARRIVVVKEKQNKADQNPYRFHHSPVEEEEDGDTNSMMASGVCGLLPQICLRSSFGVLNPVPSVRRQAQRGVSVRRMRSKYQDPTTTTPCNENHKVKLNGSSTPEGKERLENLSSASRTKTSKNFGELLASDDNTWEPSSEAPVVEKTLYVDTVHSVDKKVQEESLLKDYPSLEVVPVKEDVQNLNGASEEAISGLKVEECADQAFAEVVEITKEKSDLEVKLQQGNKTDLESSRFHHHHIVAPPPLPKAPSDSWLKRTLPTIPSKNNSFTWLQSLGIDDNNNQITKSIQENLKWETMVKTSNTQQGFVCISKDTLNPIPEA
ncbi:unnamed protein product [Brassica rapa]|uniref:Uncharacterized protein n=2 Tax=Brassica campestris TaxID=3711 RepID=A0A3P6CKP2_BRACM|nr:unnamed protein product [Brassica rapa]VDD14308.1 unnamed protein product [Brassica rapa]